MPNVTIIIPAFNHADLVCRCISSVLATVDTRHRIIIADDHSTEEGFERTVKAAIGGAPNVRYVRNGRNLGFVQTCNQTVAFAEKDTDILLLNSDAVLTEGAVEEMIACLAASDRHGVVCPRSNAATLLTFPQKHRDLPGHRDRSFACWRRLSERLPRYSVVPTGVGFCMLVRRDLIGRFAFFDGIYGRGYNEENDFCMRIARYGFSTVAANRAYVFHDEEGSFSPEEHARLEKKNRRILLARYPEYRRSVENYFRRLPWYECFADLLGGYEDRKRILIDLSGLIPAFNGTSEYALSLLPELLPLLIQYDVSILISRNSDAFFGLSGSYPRVLISEDKPSERFDLAFVPQQIFELDHLERLHRMAVKWVVSMQDVIALRCLTIQHPHSPEVVRFIARYATGILSVTRSSLNDFVSWIGSPLRSGLITAAVHHAYPSRNLRKNPPSSEKLPDPGFVFVVGNHYNHKAVREAVESLPTDRPIVVLGSRVHAEACRKRGALLIESGELPDDVVTALYERAAVVVFPTQYEGFGLPFLHAAAAGTHIVAFDSETAREVVSAFGLQSQATLCADFREMAAVTGLRRSGKYPKPRVFRSWKDVARETADVIIAALDAPVDDDLLRERFEVFGIMDALRRKVVRDCFSPRGFAHYLSRLLHKIFFSCTRSFFG